MFLVNWNPGYDGDVGGFDWTIAGREWAEQRRIELRDPSAEVHIVALPASLGVPRDGETHEQHFDRITDWLDDQGWSDGGAHHLPSAELAED